MSNFLLLAFLVIVVRMILKCLPSWFTVVPAVVHTCTYVENSEGGYKLTYQIGDSQDAYYVDDEHFQAELTQGERVNLIVLQQAPLRVCLDTVLARIGLELVGVLVVVFGVAVYHSP